MLPENIGVKQQKLLAWGLLAVVMLAGLFFLIVPLLQKSFELNEQMDKGYDQLARFRQIAKASPELMFEYQRVQQQGLDTLFYPAGMTSAQVAMELQGNLTTVITRDNGVLISSEVVDEQNTEDANANKSALYQRVMIKAVFQCTPALLREILHQAYRARPLLFVESLDIKPLESEDGQGQLVKAEVQISTYWRGGEVSDEKAN